MRRSTAYLLALLPLLIVAGVLLFLRSSGSAAPTSVSGATGDTASLCGDPRTPFTRFWLVSAEPNDSWYAGTVIVGPARVPALAMYVSGGAPGEGTMCVSTQVEVAPTIQSTAQPLPGPIAYVGSVAGGPLYFAVRPGVVRVTVEGGGRTSTHTLDGTGELQLQALGEGWHAADTGVGTDAQTMTVRAYDTAGTVTDTVVHTMPPYPYSPSAAPS